MVSEALVIRVDCFEEADFDHVFGTERFESARVLHFLKCLGDVLFQDLIVALLQELDEAGEFGEVSNTRCDRLKRRVLRCVIV